jgi:hypothetical protein
MGFKFFNEFFGRSSNWRNVRAEHLKQYPECAACGRKDNLEVHHIIPYHICPDKELDPTNLITLCDKYCHFVFGHLMDYKSWNVNVIEDCQKYSIDKKNRPKIEVFASNYYKGENNAILNYFNWSFIYKYIKCWYNRSKD